MNRYGSIFATGLIAFACLTGCGGTKPANLTASAAAPAPASAPVQAAAPAPFSVSAPIIVENQVEVTAQREGVVASIRADVGTSVRKGGLLATLDDRQLKADRDAAERKVQSIGFDEKNWQARVKVAEADFERADKMMKAELITREQLEHAQYTLDASRNELERERQDYAGAQAALKSYDLELEKMRIVAPFSGVVARRYVRVGQKVANDDRLFWVTAVAPLRVKFTLPEEFAGRVAQGQQVTVASAVAPQLRHAARIIRVSPVIDPASGSFEVTAELLGKPADLRPGMTANVELEKRP